MESFRYQDLGRIAYADALERQTAAFDALLLSYNMICNLSDRLMRFFRF